MYYMYTTLKLSMYYISRVHYAAFYVYYSLQAIKYAHTLCHVRSMLCMYPIYTVLIYTVTYILYICI